MIWPSDLTVDPSSASAYAVRCLRATLVAMRAIVASGVPAACFGPSAPAQVAMCSAVAPPLSSPPHSSPTVLRTLEPVPATPHSASASGRKRHRRDSLASSQHKQPRQRRGPTTPRCSFPLSPSTQSPPIVARSLEQLLATNPSAPTSRQKRHQVTSSLAPNRGEQSHQSSGDSPHHIMVFFSFISSFSPSDPCFAC